MRIGTDLSRTRLRTSLVQAFTLVGLLGLWELASRQDILPSRLFPPPSEVAIALGEGIFSGVLLEHAAVSVERLLIGLGISISVGLVAGLIMGKVAAVRLAALPLVRFLYPIPVPALIPVVLVLTGLANSLYVAIVAIATGIPITIATVDAVRAVDPVVLESGLTLGASKRKLFLNVLIPAVLPRIVHAMYVTFGMGLIVLTTAEILVSTEGLGNVIAVAGLQFRNDDMLAGVLLIGVIGIGQGAIVRWLGGRIAPWEASYTAKQW